MDIYSCKTSRSCKNVLVNVTINNIIKLFLKHQWFLLLKNSLTEVHCRLINLILIKRKVQVNKAVDFLMIWILKKSVCRLFDAKLKYKSIRAGNAL